MNYTLTQVPERTQQPRNSGLTMVMDKGLSVREVEDMLSTSSNHIDIVKLGWATSFVTPNIQEKIAIYKSANIPVYFGGTLFEAFVVRGQFEDYMRILDKYDLDLAEVSDGSITLPHEEKCDYISKLAARGRVLSEVGSKDAEKIFAPYKWIQMMQAELDAGSWKVIGEAREGGNIGLYRSSGEVRQGLVDEIMHAISAENIIWEAPQKSQQVYFVKLVGQNVNLGNIAPNEIIPLETIRLGLRGDTFSTFLSDDIKQKYRLGKYYQDERIRQDEN
ncbi:MAG: phosphosulfolactate synthase [Cytophagaceae bacterium]|nr:phosphosulfolactate synthase [Cytophagaceae bacterium]MBK9510089.1 phosphosulfolactate synthase [Cytophagaceae bacterium]MBK9933489.1 phosphosulfolactate synthase [Cytophagaceae bacterium]MBL0302799.1 phosphosulfolactate synthase [Cytophagaceae bacterium]MBL0325620.1 phosphosulfolactate synthase [Cytophagaceae bacterium]